MGTSLKITLQVEGKPSLFVANLAAPALKPDEVPDRPITVRKGTTHTSLSDGSNRSAQVRWHRYEWGSSGESCDEVFIGNSSIDRALGYFKGNVTVSIMENGEETVWNRDALRFYDGTGYWFRRGRLPFNPHRSAATIVPQVNSATVQEILNALPSKMTVASRPNPIATEEFAIHGAMWRIDKQPNTMQTGSGRAIGVLDDDVAAQYPRFTPDPGDDKYADEALERLFIFTEQQARRPYHYITDTGVPYNVQYHADAMIGVGGIAVMYSHFNRFGREGDIPVPPASEKNPYTAFDPHHLEVDRLAWTYLLTGSRMAMDEFFLLAEAQREYPPCKGAGADAPRAWAWSLRAIGWAYFLRSLIRTPEYPHLAGYEITLNNLITSFAIRNSFPNPFYIFSQYADGRHLMPKLDEICFYMEKYLGLDPATPELWQPLADANTALAEAEALPDSDKYKSFKVSEAKKKQTWAQVAWIEEQRGAEAKKQVLLLWAFVPIDQIAIGICALINTLSLFKATGNMVLWVKYRDILLIWVQYLWVRGSNREEPNGTFYEDTGALLHDHHTGGFATDGTAIWKAGALAYFLASYRHLVDTTQASLLKAHAERVLAASPHIQPGDWEGMFFGWTWARETDAYQGIPLPT